LVAALADLLFAAASLLAVVLGLDVVELPPAELVLGAPPPMGAVDWPSICAWTSALKTPVISVRLPQNQLGSRKKRRATNAKMWEKANAGMAALLASLRLRDSKRMKLRARL
jgi:hypothetical protein